MTFCGGISVRRIIHAYARIIRRLVPAGLIGLLETVESLRRAAVRVGGRAGGAGGVEIAQRGPGRGIETVFEFDPVSYFDVTNPK